MFHLCRAKSAKLRICFCGLQHPCGYFDMRVFWLRMIHTLNKRFGGKVMFVVDTSQSSKSRIYFVAFCHNLGAFPCERSGCAWSTHWTSAFVGKQCDLFAKRKVQNAESAFLAFSRLVGAFAHEHSRCAMFIHWTSAFVGRVMCLVGAAQSFKHRISFFGFQPPCRCFYMRAFSLCVVHTLNKRFRGKWCVWF